MESDGDKMDNNGTIKNEDDKVTLLSSDGDEALAVDYSQTELKIDRSLPTSERYCSLKIDFDLHWKYISCEHQVWI